MTHQWKVGDRIQLEGTVMAVSGGWTYVQMRGNTGVDYNSITGAAMAHATLLPPERPAIKAGQLWEDASGSEVRIATPTNETEAFYRDYKFIGMAVDCIRNYRPDGTRWREDVTGPSYLVKLIEDVAAEVQQEAKAPPPPDTSKPMRLKTDHAPVRYLDTGVHGDIWCRTQEGIVCSFKPDALENIPTLKRTMTRDVVMVEGIGSLILGGEFCKNKIIARGTITLTEGDGL